MTPVSTGAAGYIQLVRDNSDFRKLYFGEIVSLLGDWFNFIAVQTLVFELTHSGLATGLVIIVSNLPAFILTPFAGTIVDRFDRRKIMIVADLARAVIALGMILVHDSTQIWLIYVLMGLLVVFSSFFNPALSAAVPNLVSREQLLTANALTNATWGVMLAVGTFLGGVAIATVGQDAAFVINSLSFAFSAAMLMLIRTPFAESVTRRVLQLNPFADFAEALAFAWKRPQILALLLVKTGGGLAGGVILLLTIFAFQVFNVGSIGIGLLQFARGVGILSGPLLVAPFIRGQIDRAQRVISFGFLLTGLAYIVFGSTPTIVLGMLAVVSAHIGWASNWTLSATLLQRLTPDRIRGRVFSMDIGLLTLTLAFSTFVTGAATDRFDPRTVAYVLGAVFVIYGILWTGAVVLSRRRHPEKWQDGHIERVTVLEEGYAVTGE